MTAKDTRAGGPGLYEEFAASLLWPKLVRAAALAARPQRLAMGFFLVVLVGAIGQIRLPWADPGAAPYLEAALSAKLRAFQLIWLGIVSLQPEAILSGGAALVHDLPAMLFRDYPAATLLLGLPIALVVAILGGCIARSAACEVSQEIVHAWPRALAFGIARWRSFLGVLLIPAIIFALIAFILAAGGWLFFIGLPVLDIVGALLFGPALLLGIIAVVLLTLWILAWPMLLPAAACEGTDAIDAAQRAFAYALARPLRLFWYLFVAALLGTLAVGVAWLLAEGADRFARAATASWASPQGVAAITGGFPPEAALYADGSPRELRTTMNAAAGIIDFWSSILAIAVGAYAASYVFTSGTLVYLFMREVCDGQHHSELWTPGLVETTFRASMNPSPAPAPPPITPAAAVPDDGE